MRKVTRIAIAIVLVVAVLFSIRPKPSQAGSMPVITVTATPSSVVYQQTWTLQVTVTDLAGSPLLGTAVMFYATATSGGAFGPLTGDIPLQLNSHGQMTDPGENLCASGAIFYGFNYDNPPAGVNAVDTYAFGMTPLAGMPNSVVVSCTKANTTTQVSSTTQAPAGVDVSFGVQVTPVAPSSNTYNYGYCIPSPNGAGVSVAVDGAEEANLGLTCSNTDLSGYGSFDYVFTTVGTHTVTFTFNGTADYNSSSVTQTILITQPRRR